MITAYILGFLLIFGPKHGLIDIVSITGLVIIAISLLKGQGIKIRAMYPIFFLSILLAYSLVICLANGSIDFYYPLRFTRALITFVASYFLVAWLTKGKKALPGVTIVSFIYFILSFHALVMFFEYIYPGFRGLIYTYYSGFAPPGPSGIRVAGLTISLGYLSVIQGIGLLMYPFVYKMVHRGRMKMAVSFCAILLLFSVIISGRTGLVLLILLFPLSLWWAGGVRSVLWIAKRLVILVIMLGILFWLGASSISLSSNQTLVVTAQHEFDLITNLTMGKLGNDSLNELLKHHYFLPNDPIVFLFGNSRIYHGRGVVNPQAVQSDVGYVVNLFGLGVIGSVMILGFYFIIALYAIKTIGKDPPIGAILLLIIASSFGSNFVQVALFTRHSFEIMSMVFWGLFLSKFSDSVKKSCNK